MIQHSVNDKAELVGTWLCDQCEQPIGDSRYAECVWTDENPPRIMVGHTRCTRTMYDYSNNITFDEYLERLNK